MSEICLITDLHFGCRNNSEIFLESQLKFFTEQLVPELKERNIKKIYVLGDFFDNRSQINVKIQNSVKYLLDNYLTEFEMYILVGNHDIYYKTTIETHSLQFLKKYNNITVVDKIMKIKEGDREFLLVPWQVDEELFKQKVVNQNLTCDVCFGHFEISGFNFNNNRVCEDGITSQLFFDNFKKIFSGHFHKRSENSLGDSTISYIGNPYQLTRNDMDNERGYTILNTETLETEFIENKKSLKYVKITYPQIITEDIIKGNIVDIEIEYNENYNEEMVNKYIKEIEEFEPIQPPIIKLENNMDTVDTKNLEIKSISGLLNDYIKSLEIDNKERIYKKTMIFYEQVKGQVE
jgi:DNA repair exonuclease SbcCD nuclease subunit